jgi:membrane dipeptidase
MSAISDQARSLLGDALVWDMVFVYEPELGNDSRLFPRYRQAGVDFISCHPAGDNHNTTEAIKRVARFRHQVMADPDAVLVENADDILRAKAAGKLAVGLHLEGFRPLERDLNLIELFHKLGVRFVHPIFNQLNSIGGGSAERYDVGLSRYGIKVVQEMSRVGILVDAAHAGYQTSLDMLEYSERPVIFSHLGCHSLREHYRNVRDDQIRLCAERGGMVGITSAGFYLGDTSTETYFRHVNHVAELVGPEHVGLGLDYMIDTASLQAFIEARPEEWPGIEDGLWEPMAFFMPEQIGELVELLLQRGYSEANVRGILGENWLRVCREVWR